MIHCPISTKLKYIETSNIICTSVGNKIVDHSDVLGASPGGAAPTTAIFILDFILGFKGLGRGDEMKRETFKCWDLVAIYQRFNIIYQIQIIQKASHIIPTWAMYGLFVVSISEKWDHTLLISASLLCCHVYRSREVSHTALSLLECVEVSQITAISTHSDDNIEALAIMSSQNIYTPM